METGSVSLYGLKPASLNFHPPPTCTLSVSQQAIHLNFHVLHSTPTPSQKAASKPVHNPWKHPGSKSDIQSPKLQTVPP